MPQQFFPDSPREEILIDVQLEDGASHAATMSEVERIEQLLREDAQVRDFTTYVGSGPPHFYLSLDPETPKLNYAQVIVYPHEPGQSGPLTLALRERLAAAFAHIRAHVYRLELGPSVGYPVQFRVRGADPDTVRHIAAQVALTAPAAILAMITLTSSVFWGPMAIAIVGGLSVATILTLFVVSALYAAWFGMEREEVMSYA